MSNMTDTKDKVNLKYATAQQSTEKRNVERELERLRYGWHSAAEKQKRRQQTELALSDRQAEIEAPRAIRPEETSKKVHHHAIQRSAVRSGAVQQLDPVPSRQVRQAPEVWTAYEPETEAIPAVKQENRVIREIRLKRQRRKIKGWLLVKVSLIFALGLLVVFRYASITELGYKASRANQTYTRLQNENQRLEADIAGKMNIAEVARLAVERLGMQKPQDYQIVHIDLSPVDQTEAYRVEYTKDRHDSPWYDRVIRDVRSFLGLV